MKFKLLILFSSLALCLHAQEKVEYLPYGRMDSWTVRYIKESVLLGGRVISMYSSVLGSTVMLKPSRY